MLLRLNRIMRKIVLAVGAVCAIFKLIELSAAHPQEKQEEFQTEEFDDIW